MRYLLKSCLAVLVLTTTLPVTQAQTLAWTLNGTPDRVQSGTVGLPAPTDLWISPTPPSNSPWGITYNSVNDRVYWTDLSARQVNTVRMDGTGFSTAFSYPNATIASVTLDTPNQHLYFVAGAGASSIIVKSNLDGSGQSTFTTHASGSNAWLTVDPVGRYLYWSDTANNFDPPRQPRRPPSHAKRRRPQQLWRSHRSRRRSRRAR